MKQLSPGDGAIALRMKIAFVTTCKGRLHHLKRSLPLMVAQGAAEVIVVDYGCPDQSGAWVEANFPAVKVVRVTDDPAFSLARARNFGARESQSDWLVFIDADIETAAGWAGWMQDHLESGHFYRVAPIDGERDHEAYGTVICARQDYEAIGGFDEAFRGWAGEDEDFYDRLVRHGALQADYPAEFVNPIRHGDEERIGMTPGWSRHRQIIVNQCYIAAKRHFGMLGGRDDALPLEKRIELLETTQKVLVKWFGEGAREPLTIRYSLRGNEARWLPAPYAMATESTFIVRVGRRRRTARSAVGAEPSGG